MDSSEDETSSSQITEARAPPTTQELLELSGEDQLDQVRELVLRDAGLAAIGTLLEPLVALEVLSLSNNLLRSLEGCSLARLLVLNVNFNRIASLEGAQQVVRE